MCVETTKKEIGIFGLDVHMAEHFFIEWISTRHNQLMV